MACRLDRVAPATLLAFLAAGNAFGVEYRGLCEASAGAYVDAEHFAVASDETNRLQLYRRGNPQPIGSGFDMEEFTSFDKSDLEAAAAIGDRVYWMSSHSFNRDGEDKAKRKLFFATRFAVSDGRPTLVPVGHPIKSLRDGIARAAGVAPRELNIEALAADADGGLLIGLRAPLRDGKAIVLAFRNPAAVIDRKAEPEFGAPVLVDLGGRGLRGMERLAGNDAPYIIAAGMAADSAEGFAMFRWSGPGSDPVRIDGVDLAGLRPEVAMGVSGQGVVQVLSDDGDVCSDEDGSPAARRFRSIDVTP